MATTLFLQLDGSKGLMEVLAFSGLSHPMLVHPIVHGEPVLTVQAFYYLEQLEAVANVRFEAPADHLSDGEVEYLVDNYLFEYSKLRPEARLSFKITEGKFWEDDVPEFYLMADQRDTEVLVLDVLNDKHVHQIEAIDPSDRVDLTDWDIGRNYARDAFEPYQAAMETLLEKKVTAFVAPSTHRDGYMGKLRVVKSGDGLITRAQAERLSEISLRSISPTDTSVKLAATDVAKACEDIPLRRVVASKQYNPLMLSHYFSGLKELNPLKAFVGFYNVLEYYFEEAPRILGRSATNELAQLKCVVELISTAAVVGTFFSNLPAPVSHAIFADLPTSSGLTISRITHSPDLRHDLARWLYEIRCAVIHSKKTRRGAPTPSFEPYSQSSNAVREVIPIVQWLAVRCIEKDQELAIAVPAPTVSAGP
jgi:hypothetical protein